MEIKRDESEAGGSMSIKSGFYGLEVGETAWYVKHRDNSDMGLAEKWFATLEDAQAYMNALPDPPEGNEQHPAPESYALRLFEVRCDTVWP